METARDLAQLLEPGVELGGGDSAAASPADAGSALQRACADAQRQRSRDEPLLRAVVEVALEPPPLLVAGPDERARDALQVGARLSARDRERHELAERAEPVLGSRAAAGSALAIATAPQSAPATTIGAAAVER